MADIKHTHASPAPTGPTEGDGISYSGIVWFVAILVITTVACSVLVWWAHEWRLKNLDATDAARPPHATNAPPPQPNLISLDSWHPEAGGPKLPLGEPSYLQHYRKTEETTLTTYGWIDQNAGVVRIPIDRAKALVLEKGLPARSAAPAK
jgi:hypothetical protein